MGANIPCYRITLWYWKEGIECEARENEARSVWRECELGWQDGRYFLEVGKYLPGPTNQSPQAFLLSSLACS